MKRMIRILGTGGTIAGVAAPGAAESRYDAGELAIRELVEPLLPTLSAWIDEVSPLDVAQVDSSNMSHQVWAALAQAAQAAIDDPAVVGIVITHGTDTLEETALFLEGVLRPNKPVVLTAAMRPATSAQADGPRHLTQAVRLACHASRAGLWMAFGGVAWPAAQVRKLHPFALEAFGAGDARPAWVWRDGDWHPSQAQEPLAPQGSAETGAKTDLASHGLLAPGAVPVTMPSDVEQWPRVEIVCSHAGAQGRLIDLLLQDGVRGLVISATGNGSVHEALDRALTRAVEQGRISRSAICVASRCLGGWVEGDPAHGWPTAHRLTPAQARVALMLSLVRRRSQADSRF